MLLIFVEHFLNQEGRSYFKEWLIQIRDVLTKYEGFESIERMEDVENRDRSLLILKFKNLELLRRWSKSKEHDEMIGLLKKYMLKKQKSQILEISE